jgi:hypothetical protein
MNFAPVISATGTVPVIDETNNSIEIVIHINETLDGATRKVLQAAILEKDNGMLSAEFTPLRYHLLLVQYDRRKLNSAGALAIVMAQNLSAQLVGPI